MTPTEQDNELRALLGEMPNFVIDWLELSDDLRNEWKKGGKASDFGGHRAFIQKYEEKLAKLITADRKRVALEARISELKMWELPENEIQMVFANPCNICGHDYPKLRKAQQDRLSALKAQQEEV